MKQFILLILAVVGCSVWANAQCNPNAAILICGNNANPINTAPKCNGQPITVPVCSSSPTTFTDVNSEYYTFVCYVSGPLEFSITPHNLGDDYDWQLFDITGKMPNDIYNASLANQIFVVCNWSGNPGITGTSLTSTLANGCDGNFNPISKAPNLIQGHTYILMVSHFTSTNQSGYDIKFEGNTPALVSNPINQPKVDTVTALCDGKTLNIKINKKVKCSSIDITDFNIATNPTIQSKKGIGCVFPTDYTDSIIITLANPLPSGLYAFNIQKGNDNNTLVDECEVEMIAGQNLKQINVYQTPNPNFTYTIKNETCKADTLIYTHDGNNATNKWQWTFDGTPTSSTSQTQQVIYNSFNSRVVKLKVSNALCSDSITKNIPIADHILIPKINVTRDTTCPNNPETFSDASTGTITSRFWDFKNGQTATVATPPSQIYPVLPVNKIYNTTLTVTNPIGCKDSAVKNIFVRGTIPTEFDSIIPPTCAAKEVKIYFNQAMYCNSIEPTGTDFAITGASPNSILSAKVICLDTVGSIVSLQLANELVTGTYNLSLKVGSDGNTIINDCGIATLPKTLTFKAFGHINAQFDSIVKWGCKADTFTLRHFTNNLSNNWQWNFVDGSPNMATSSLQNPTVIYNDVTTNHTVQLVVSNGVCFDTSNQTLNIIDHSINAKFGMPDTTCGNGNTPFTDSSAGFITNWNWNFGDGQTSSIKSPTHNFPLLYVYKTYPVQLIVKNKVNCLDTTLPKNIVVKPSSAALMDRVDYDICSPDSFIVYFNAPMLCNTVEPNGTDFTITGASTPTIASAKIINCTNGVGRTVVVKLSSPINVGGNYNLNLVKGTDGNTILNDCGIETQPSLLIFTTHNKVDASFTSINKMNCKTDTLFLTHTVANEENKWTWYVNGIQTNFLPTLVLPYKESSIKHIVLMVANATCKDTAEQTFTLTFDKIKAKIWVNNSIVCPTDLVLFKDTSTGNITSWLWSFDNNNPPSIDKNPPAQTYTTPQYPINPTTGQVFNSYDIAYTKTITLVVGNNIPCYDTAKQTLKIAPNCFIQVPTAFTPNGDGLNDFLKPLNTYKATKLSFKVFNRLGRLVFTTDDIGGKWEGKFVGQKQPAGTYVWTLNYTDKDTGQEIFLKGTSVLIR